MSTLPSQGRSRKLLASFFVLTLVVGVQWFIFQRTRPPQPAIEFPKELKDIAP